MSKITKAIAVLGIVAGFGVAALPLGTYAANPEEVAVSFIVAPTLGSDATVCESAHQDTAIAAGTKATVTCAIGYSANSGASVTIVDKDSSANLVHSTVPSKTIAPLATPAAELSGESWGYKFAVVNNGAATGGLTQTTGFNTTYRGVTTGAAVEVGKSTSPTTSASGNFTFGVSTLETTQAGTYQDVVIIAITAQ